MLLKALYRVDQEYLNSVPFDEYKNYVKKQFAVDVGTKIMEYTKMSERVKPDKLIPFKDQVEFSIETVFLTKEQFDHIMSCLRLIESTSNPQVANLAFEIKKTLVEGV